MDVGGQLQRRASCTVPRFTYNSLFPCPRTVLGASSVATASRPRRAWPTAVPLAPLATALRRAARTAGRQSRSRLTSSSNSARSGSRVGAGSGCGGGAGGGSDTAGGSSRAPLSFSCCATARSRSLRDCAASWRSRSAGRALELAGAGTGSPGGGCASNSEGRPAQPALAVGGRCRPVGPAFLLPAWRSWLTSLQAAAASAPPRRLLEKPPEALVLHIEG